MARSMGSKRSARSRIATASLAIHFTRRPLASLSCAVGGTKSRASISARLWRWRAIRWNADSSISALANASEAIRHRRQLWNPQIVCIEKSQADKRSPDLIRGRTPNASLAAPTPRQWPEKKLSAAASFKRLEGRRTELMTNKSHAITISLFRIGVLAVQIAVSPSAAAQSTAGAGSQQPALMDREREIAL